VALSFLLSSCSLLKTSKQKLTLDQLDNALSKVCLSAEGKGRINYLGTKYVFALETLLDESLWSLALQIPAYGEEILRFDWSKADQGRIKILGSFYRRLKIQSRNVKSGSKQMKLLNAYLLRLGLFIKLQQMAGTGKLAKHCKVTNENQFGMSGTCSIGRKEVFFSFKGQHLFFDFKLAKENLRLDFFDGAEHYKRFSVYKSEASSGNKMNSLISMDLFLASCNAK